MSPIIDNFQIFVVILISDLGFFLYADIKIQRFAIPFKISILKILTQKRTYFNSVLIHYQFGRLLTHCMEMKLLRTIKDTL